MKELNKETAILLEKYCNSVCNLYGIIPLSKLLEIYNSQNQPLSKEEFLNYIRALDLDGKFFVFVADDEIIEDATKVSSLNYDLVAEYLICVGDLEDYYDTKIEQANVPYYIPEKSKLLKYEDEFYHEKSLSYISLRAFFRNQPSLTKEVADDITENIYGSADVYKCDAEAMVDLIKHQFEFTQATLDEFMPLYLDMFNDIRLHIYRGHTTNEMEELLL